MLRERAGEVDPLDALMLTPDEGHLDRRIAQEAATLAARGWTVDIHPAVDPRLGYEGDLLADVRLLANPRPPVRPSGPGRAILRRAKRRLDRRVPPVARFIEAAQYRRRDIAGEITDANLPHLLAGRRYDLVVAHDVPVMPLAARLAAAWGAALVSDLHEVFPEQDEHFTSAVARSYWRRLEGTGLAASDGIVCVNAAVADYARETHAPGAPMAVVHNAVPFVTPSVHRSGPSLRSLYPIPEEARILLFAGSLRPHKGLEVLIDGLAASDLQGFVLTILGDGPLQHALEERIVRRGLAGRAFVGRRAPERDLIAVASSADVALLPYQEVGFNYRIATPNKLFEYIQARLPIATSRLPGIERIVAPLATAGFVDFSSAATTARGLEAFVRNVLPAVTPGALERAAAAASWEREEPAFLDLVDRAMRRHRAPAATAP